MNDVPYNANGLQCYVVFSFNSQIAFGQIVLRKFINIYSQLCVLSALQTILKIFIHAKHYVLMHASYSTLRYAVTTQNNIIHFL